VRTRGIEAIGSLGSEMIWRPLIPLSKNAAEGDESLALAIEEKWLRVSRREITASLRIL
jgi:hypothetical protein